MAAAPNHPRPSSSSLRSSTVGRGGAGNVGYTPRDIDPSTLETPHLRSERYTTGRGGTGNMARNTDAEEARRAQDVVAPPHKESLSSTHIGRGGAANVFNPNREDIARAKRETAFDGGKSVADDKGLAEKGKQWLLNKVGGKS